MTARYRCSDLALRSAVRPRAACEATEDPDGGLHVDRLSVSAIANVNVWPAGELAERCANRLQWRLLRARVRVVATIRVDEDTDLVDDALRCILRIHGPIATRRQDERIAPRV